MAGFGGALMTDFVEKLFSGVPGRYKRVGFAREGDFFEAWAQLANGKYTPVYRDDSFIGAAMKLHEAT